MKTQLPHNFRPPLPPPAIKGPTIIRVEPAAKVDYLAHVASTAPEVNTTQPEPIRRRYASGGRGCL